MAESELRSEQRTFSKDQLILPEKQLPQEVSDILQRAEKAGIKTFEPYHLSNITLTKDSKVEGWDKKPRDWYWEEIEHGNLDEDAAKLADSWILIDKTIRPNYRNGNQVHENDPFGVLMERLRKEGKVGSMDDTHTIDPKFSRKMPATSRFGVSYDELVEIIFPEIAKTLGVDKSQVRLPKAIEFNVVGNFKHPEWGEVNTREWFADKFKYDKDSVSIYHMNGGDSKQGGSGLARSYEHNWSNSKGDDIAFRPLVVVPTKG